MGGYVEGDVWEDLLRDFRGCGGEIGGVYLYGL